MNMVYGDRSLYAENSNRGFAVPHIYQCGIWCAWTSHI